MTSVAACILTVSDALDEHDMPAEDSYLSASDLEEKTTKMIEIALEAGIAA